MKTDYSGKFAAMAGQTLYPKLGQSIRQFVRQIAFDDRLTLQELRQVAEIARDLEMWGGASIQQCWTTAAASPPTAEGKKARLDRLRQHWNVLKQEANHYSPRPNNGNIAVKSNVVARSKTKLGLGFCPVASNKTRCCNLLTLDAVDNCGYHCAYCSIQSFFSANQVFFDPEFADKLARVEIDPQRVYHIGTGQSSDSLMWGNSHGVLDALIGFARANPNVILELKTKSANVAHLLDRDLPANLLCTWSLNPQIIIDHEEQGSASLQRRLEAALALQHRGHLVGFHFHPMIHFAGWRKEYQGISEQLQRRFDPGLTAMISIGTLTYTKPVMRKIREQGSASQILKMPLVEADGKFSYPDATKTELFSALYQSFSEEWQASVFFYLCMENQRFWKPVFGYDYPDNDALEQAMKSAYLNKILAAGGSRAG